MIATLIGATAAVITGIGKYKMLEKMGEKGWKAFVPFLGEYILYKRVWNTKMFWASLATSLAAGGFFQAATQMAHPNMALATVAFGFAVVATGIGLEFLHKIARSFGHGVRCTLGLMIAEPITCLALGFGKSEYAAA